MRERPRQPGRVIVAKGGLTNNNTGHTRAGPRWSDPRLVALLARRLVGRAGTGAVLEQSRSSDGFTGEER